MSGNAKFRWFLLAPIAVALLVVTSPVISWASETAYVNIKKAAVNTNEWGKEISSFKSLFEKAQALIARKEKNVKKMLSDLSSDCQTCGIRRMTLKESDWVGEKIIEDHKQFVQDANQVFAKMEKEIVEKISEKMAGVVLKIGREKKIAIKNTNEDMSYGDILNLTALATSTYDSMYTSSDPLVSTLYTQEVDRLALPQKTLRELWLQVLKQHYPERSFNHLYKN